ncbi:MAG: hypothetical protein JNM43_28270 [Planctomycetaceae bacterium]|nr:hypothetical protein [Planctomycetaceae bacterium]
MTAKHSSRLLALLEAASVSELPPSDSFSDLSEELKSQLRLHVLNRNEIDPEADDAVLELIRKEPRGLLMLRSLLRDAEAVDQLGPVPQSIIQRQINQLLMKTPLSLSDVIVARGKTGLRYVGKVPAGTTASFEMARSNQEVTTTLSHTQQMDSCAITVTVETQQSELFTLHLEFTFVSPALRKAMLEVRVAEEFGMFSASQPVVNKEAAFEGLRCASYQIEIMADSRIVDRFRIQLQFESA